MKPISDTGWKNSERHNLNVGYHDQERVIVWDTLAEREYIDGYLDGVKASYGMHMWYYVKKATEERTISDSEIAPHIVYTLRAGYDSGD